MIEWSYANYPIRKYTCKECDCKLVRARVAPCPKCGGDMTSEKFPTRLQVVK